MMVPVIPQCPLGWELRGLQMRQMTDDNLKANGIKRLATPTWSET